MRKIMLAFAAVLAALLTGCGHNAVHYGDGIGFDAGINPENWTASFTLRYGKILSTVTRDNVEIELTGNANANTQNGGEKTALTKVGTDGKVGTQTLGDYFKTDKGKAELMKHIDSTSISLNDDAVGSYTVNTSNNGKTIYWYVAYKVHDGSNKDESLMNKLEAKAATADLRRTSNFKNTNEKYHAGNETNKNIYMLIMTFNY